MGQIISDRVKDTTTTTGTGTITLSGTPPTGFVAFGTVGATGDQFYYCISSSGGSEWEVGYGTLASSTTFTRDRVLTSSNSNALVNFSAGTKDVFIDAPAEVIQTKGQNLAFAGGIVTY